jgi:hypothetical protein
MDLTVVTGNITFCSSNAVRTSPAKSLRNMAFWVANVVLYDPAAALTLPSQFPVAVVIIISFYFKNC